MVRKNFELLYRPSEKYAKYLNICSLMITLGPLFCVKQPDGSRHTYIYIYTYYCNPFEFNVIHSFKSCIHVDLNLYLTSKMGILINLASVNNEKQ